jgi:SAM-dependent methyltransferase
MEETEPAWDYAAIVRDAMAGARRTLDIDTGGGEFLSNILPAPGSVVATEGYAPNVAVAGARLAPLGVPVVHALSAADNVDQAADAGTWSTRVTLPFADGAFDLAINRHSSYVASEVWRVLRPGGRYLTQQWSDEGTSGAGWDELFGRPLPAGPAFDVGFATGQLTEAGFEILGAERCDTPLVFHDLVAVVYYLLAVPWAVTDFDPVADREALHRVHRRIGRDGELRIRAGAMMIDARRRGATSTDAAR